MNIPFEIYTKKIADKQVSNKYVYETPRNFHQSYFCNLHSMEAVVYSRRHDIKKQLRTKSSYLIAVEIFQFLRVFAIITYSWSTKARSGAWK